MNKPKNVVITGGNSGVGFEQSKVYTVKVTMLFWFKKCFKKSIGRQSDHSNSRWNSHSISFGFISQKICLIVCEKCEIKI
jgi:hypothetical protein